MSRSFSCERDLLADELAVLEQRLVGRIDDDDPVEAVEQRVLAGLQFLAAQSFKPTTAGMRSDRAMMAVCDVLLPMSVANPSTLVRSICAVFDGRQVVADDDARLRQMPQVGLVLAAQQIVQHPRGHVAHVGRAFAQIIVVDGGQRGGVALGDGVKGVLRVDLFAV